MCDSYNHLPKINYKKTFNQKSSKVQKLIREALQILSCLGIPVEEYSERSKEKMAMALLAVGDVKKSSEWKKIKDTRNSYSLTTREIIDFHNTYLEEDISSGSYDDIRRKDLQAMLVCEIVVQSAEDANISDPTRGYQISAEYARIIKNYGQTDWFKQVENFNKSHLSYKDRITVKREIKKLKVTTSDGKIIELKDGEHNAIQKAVIEEFLPRYGFGAEVLYCGDSDNKYGIVFDEERLNEIGLSNLKQGKLPDVIAYSAEKDWIFLIEAYHTSNPISDLRKYELATKVLGESADKAIYVTAFENVHSYNSCPEELAWETEVWIATEPNHMIHRNGNRFLGPYSTKNQDAKKQE